MEITMMEVKYNPDNVITGWQNVQEFIQHALLVAFDGCHKIYLAMDEYEEKWFRDSYPHIVDGSPDDMFITTQRWFDESCALRLVSAVYRVEEDPNKGYKQLIRQFAIDPNEEETPVTDE